MLSTLGITLLAIVMAFCSAPFLTPPHTQAPFALLKETARYYDTLNGYELEGLARTTVSTIEECQIEFPFQAIKPSLRLESEPQRATVPPTVRFSRPWFPKACTGQLAHRGGISLPADWLALEKVDVGIKSVRELPDQVLRLGEKAVHCRIVEVNYDDYYRRLRRLGGSVRYWIGSETHQIWRIESREKLGDGRMVPWVVTLFSSRTGADIASWAAEDAAEGLATLIGRPAPDFELTTSDGRIVHLSSLQGKVILLDFWATWCGACAEEIPVLEKIQTQAGPSVVIIGVSKEDAAVVRAWLEKYRRSFESLVHGNKAFNAFKVGPIPALVLIDRRGVIAYCFLGFASEDHVRQEIEKVLSNAGPD